MVFSVRLKNKEIIEKFRKFVLNKYGTLYGTLSLEVEKALEYYLESMCTHEQKHAHKSHVTCNTNYMNKTKNKLLMLLNFLISNGYERIDLNTLKEFITIKIGADKRTINKYLKILIQQGFITVERQLIKNTIFIVNRKTIINYLEVEK